MQAISGFSVPFRSRGRLIACAVALVALSVTMFAPVAANANTDHDHLPGPR